MKIVKIGNVELTEVEAFKLYESGKYIVTYSRIYQLHYCQPSQMVYGSEIYRQQGMARRGRFHAVDAKAVNHLLGFKLVLEDM